MQPADHWSAPSIDPVDLTIVLATSLEIDRAITTGLTQAGHPHLLVRPRARGAVVGPLVLPGRTSCLGCTDLARTRADPAWPRMLAQLCRTRGDWDPLAADWAAALVTTQVLSHLAGRTVETASATVELGPAGVVLAATRLVGRSGLRMLLVPARRMVTDRPGRHATTQQTSGVPHQMSDTDDPLARSSLRRGARLASLPLGFAGRATLGLGKRIGGSSAERVNAELQERAAQQLFKVLGELKGGAMKFGQTLSLFEAALPEDMAKPYREHLTRLQDSAPPMPTSRVHAVLARSSGRLEARPGRLDPRPAAAASIGQVHRGVWRDGRSVAVKVQYPGADEALRSDLRQIFRLSKLIGSLPVDHVTPPRRDDGPNPRGARLHAGGRPPAAGRRRLRRRPGVRRAAGGRLDPADGQRVDRRTPLSTVRDDRSRSRTRSGRRYVRFLFAGPQPVGLLHADPHPGNFSAGRRSARSPRLRLVARLPDGMPSVIGRVLRVAQRGDADGVCPAA